MTARKTRGDTNRKGKNMRFRGMDFRMTDTGGGCTAYEYTAPDGTYWFLVNDDAQAPAAGEKASLGQYASEEAFSNADPADPVLYADEIADFRPDAIGRCENCGQEAENVREYDVKLVGEHYGTVTDFCEPCAQMMVLHHNEKVEHVRPIAATVSHFFSEAVREHLSADELAEVNRRNAEDYFAACATHDFADANELMGAAMERAFFGNVVLFAEEDGDEGMSEANTRLWNAAWDISKRVKFSN